MKLRSLLSRTGRVDVVVQSTDKNFMVPVGGAIVAGFDKALVDSISKNYPGKSRRSVTLADFLRITIVKYHGLLSYLMPADSRSC